MFNTSKFTNSPRSNNTDLNNSINETANGISRSFIQPKITSTPLTKRDSIFATPPKHRILSPRRYSLSDIATPPRTSRRDFSKVNTGPLLASTKYNVNVSTYEDTKSPGLASRIVRYNEEMEQKKEPVRHSTHQVKYGSPGLFPVVHLFKKELPTLDQRPRKVTIRIASPEYSKYHSQEYNRKLLEGIVKPSLPPNRGNTSSLESQHNSSTRSVLDALKEISRKRIHANEDYDLDEDSVKRLRIMNNGDSNKRLRDDSLDTSLSPGKPTSKKVCMYDEYAASCSSTDFSFNKSSQPKRKSISISTLTENPKEAKQVKLINAETQTVTSEAVKDTEIVKPTANDENKDQISGKEPAEPEKNGVLKIFDDAPLERIRRNRLAALMGSLTGKEPVLLPKPDYASVLNSLVAPSDTPDATEISKSTEKPLISILSSPRKSSPVKSNKHVHFSVPESTSQTETTPTTSALSFPVLTSSTSATAPVSSTSETNLTSFVSSNTTTPETPAPPSSPVGLQATPSSSTTALPVISFGKPSTSSSTSVVSKEPSVSSVVDTPKTNFTIPNFQFNPASNSSTTSLTSASSLLTFTSPKTASGTPTTTASSPPKMGGFKFDLSKPATSSVASTAPVPSFTFGNASKSNASPAKSGLEISVASSTNTKSPVTFNFGAKAITPAVTSSFSASSTFNSVAPVTTASTLVPVRPSFKFASSSNETKPASSVGFPLSHSNTATFNVSNTTTSVPSFGANTTSASSVSSAITSTTPASSASKAPFFSFGAPKTTSSGFGMGTTTTSASSTFGVPASSSAIAVGFGTPLSTSSTSTPTGSFLSTSASLPVTSFGVTTTASTLGSGFGSISTTNNINFTSNSAPMFNTNKTAHSPFGVASATSTTPAFGTQSSSTPSPFGKSSNTPQFGQSTTQSAFGTPTTTVSFGTTNAFGTTTTTTSSGFGNSSNSSVFAGKNGGFGTPSSNSNIFGGVVNTQPSGFGVTTSKPIFGSATSSPFGASTKTTTASSFGSSNTPTFSFGPKTTASSFGSGSGFGTTTTASTGFGTSSAPAFGSSNSFGGTTNFGAGTNNAFGASSAPAFGVNTTTTQSSSFGTSTPAFASSNTGFNATDKGSAFNNSTAPAFGNTASSPFGSSTATSAFGTPNNTSGFGNSTAVSAFAKPQGTQNTFGGPTSNSFGSSNSFGAAPQPQVPSFGTTNATNAQNAVFSFGATSTPKPPGVFSFGAAPTNDVPKPTFNFSGGSSVPAFGSSATPAFGSGSAAPFSAGVPQFNAPQSSGQSMFSIGSGSSTGKARTHLKPKRRT